MNLSQNRCGKISMASGSVKPGNTGGQVVAIDFGPVPASKHWIIHRGSIVITYSANVGAIYANQMGFLICQPSTPKGGTPPSASSGYPLTAWPAYKSGILVSNIPDSANTTQLPGDGDTVYTLKREIIIPQLCTLKAFVSSQSWGSLYALHNIFSLITYIEEDNC